MVLHMLAAAGVLALLTLAPGPDLAVVTRRALIGGRGDGIRTALGVVCGLLLWGSLAVAGLSAILSASPKAYLLLKVAGVCYLVFLGIQAFRSGGQHGEAATAAPPRGRPFLTGVATNLLNPKIAVFYTALLPTLAPRASGTGGLITLVLIHAALALAWLVAYTFALDRARAFFERPRVRRALDRVTGTVLFVFAVRLATEQH
jgi:threonine/homoserine/homoserine lactone efflux protein